MTPDPASILHDLDLLDDWLAGKGYGEEAGLVLRAMTLINAQARELRELRAEIAEVNRLYKYHVDLVSQGICEANELRAENEKLRSDVRTAVFADSAELKDVKRYNEELRGLLREAWVKMEANNLWSNLRARLAAALKETGDG